MNSSNYLCCEPWGLLRQCCGAERWKTRQIKRERERSNTRKVFGIILDVNLWIALNAYQSQRQPAKRTKKDHMRTSQRILSTAHIVYWQQCAKLIIVIDAAESYDIKMKDAFNIFYNQSKYNSSAALNKFIRPPHRAAGFTTGNDSLPTCDGNNIHISESCKKEDSDLFSPSYVQIYEYCSHLMFVKIHSNNFWI